MPTMITISNVKEVVDRIVLTYARDVIPHLPDGVNYARRRIAFAPVVLPEMKKMVWSLGICTEDEPGYHPLPVGLCSFDTRDQIDLVCSIMNTELGISDREAALRIASTMRGGRANQRK